MWVARRAWAEEADLDPNVIERVYRDLVAYFIVRETQHWRSL
jgi:isochorismate pyruvate lyase